MAEGTLSKHTHTPLGFLFVSMPVWVCVCWCCCVVTGLSQGFCVSLSYVKLHRHRRLCLAPLSVLSRGSAPPSSYLSNCLNCGPQCCDPVTFTNNREINSAPPVTLSASHPANEGTARGLSLHPDNTQSLLIPRYRWQAGATTHTLYRERLNKKFLSEQNLEQTPTFSLLQQ